MKAGMPLSIRSHVGANGKAKKKFGTEASAQVSAGRLGGLAVYRCWVCGFWHVGHDPSTGAS